MAIAHHRFTKNLYRWHVKQKDLPAFANLCLVLVMKVGPCVLSLASFLFFSWPSLAGEKNFNQSDDRGIEEAQPVVSIEALGNAVGGSGAYARQAEYCLKHGYVDQAIKLCQLSLGKKDDPDLHQIYATALEQKIRGQDEKDPALFAKCVAEWLIVLRQSGGEENLSFHGIGLPGAGKFWEDEDRSMPAKQHIQQLTGHLPKVWETNERFVKRVTKQFESSVSGKLLPSTGTADSQHPGDKTNNDSKGGE